MFSSIVVRTIHLHPLQLRNAGIPVSNADSLPVVALLDAHFTIQSDFQVILGSDSIAYMQRDVEVYDPRANKWQDVASMNDTRAYFAGVACQGALYAIGGLSPEMGNPNYKQTFEKYDPVRDSWEVLQPAANTCLIEPS